MTHSFRQNEPIGINGPEVGISIKEGWIEAHEFCDKCKEMAEFKIIIENGFWTRTEPYEPIQENA